MDTLRPNRVWPRPVVVPKPFSTTGVKRPIVSLGGGWKITTDPPTGFWQDSADLSAWADVRVPGHLVPQGIVPPRDRRYAYKRKIGIPHDFGGERVLLSFEGITGLAQVWINGTYLRGHFGGFTTWQCDTTDHVRPGEEAWLTVGVTDTSEGISTFNNGGPLRDAKLLAVPQNHLARFTVETALDEGYRDAVLRAWLAVDFHTDAGVRV